MVVCHHSLHLCRWVSLKKKKKKKNFFFRETPTSPWVPFRAKFRPLGRLFRPCRPLAWSLYKWLNKTVAHCKQNIFIFKPYKSFDCVNNYIHIECFLTPDKLTLMVKRKIPWPLFEISHPAIPNFQSRGRNWKLFYFSYQNLLCGSSKELSQWDGFLSTQHTCLN